MVARGASQSTLGDVRSAHARLDRVSEVAMTAVSAPTLRKDAIGLREVLFQSITDMAPGAAIAASIPFGAAYAGGSLPLAVVFALVACLFRAVSGAELARRVPAAGSLAPYAAPGPHKTLGVLVARAD